MSNLFIILILILMIAPPVLVVRWLQARVRRRMHEKIEALVTLPAEKIAPELTDILDNGFRLSPLDLSYLVAACLPLPLVVMLGFPRWELVAFLVVAPFVLVLILVRQSFGKMNRRESMEQLIGATERIMDQEDVFKVDAWLAVLHKSYSHLVPDLNEYLIEWGSPVAWQLLRGQKKGSIAWNRLRSQNVPQRLGYDLPEDAPSQLHRITTMRRQTRFWNRLDKVLGAGELRTDDLKARYRDPIFEKHLTELDSQLRARRYHPAIVCTRCQQRSELRTTDGIEVVACPVCADHDAFELGVEEWIGVIGPAEIARREGARYVTSVWDEQTRKIAEAPVDALWIQGGAGINYDWAVAAAVEMIRNVYPARVGKLRFAVGDGIVLSANTQLLLDEMGPQVPETTFLASAGKV